MLRWALVKSVQSAAVLSAAGFKENGGCAQFLYRGIISAVSVTRIIWSHSVYSELIWISQHEKCRVVPFIVFGHLKTRNPPIDLKAERFVCLLKSVDDTPTLIRIVAEDKDYLKFCAVILFSTVGDDKQIIRMRQSFERQLTKHRLTHERLKSKLMPVAVCLGLESFRAYPDSADNDFYSVLGLSEDATNTEINTAYRRKALQTHPDTKSGSKKDFIQIQNAFRILSDKSLRQQYNSIKNKNWQWVEEPEIKMPTANLPTKLDETQRRQFFYLLMILLVLLGIVFGVDSVVKWLCV